MSNTNYSQMSTKPKSETTQSVDKTSIVKPEPDTTVTTPEETVTKQNLIGYVSNCEKLNIRSKPSTEAEVLIIVNNGTTIEVNEELSTDTFYSVVAYCPEEITVTGYAMKEYIRFDKERA